jgi:hypothetical protein
MLEEELIFSLELGSDLQEAEPAMVLLQAGESEQGLPQGFVVADYLEETGWMARYLPGLPPGGRGARLPRIHALVHRFLHQGQCHTAGRVDGEATRPVPECAGIDLCLPALTEVTRLHPWPVQEQMGDPQDYQQSTGDGMQGFEVLVNTEPQESGDSLVQYKDQHQRIQHLQSFRLRHGWLPSTGTGRFDANRPRVIDRGHPVNPRLPLKN